MKAMCSFETVETFHQCNSAVTQ